MQKPQIKIVFTNERLITPSGLTIVGGMLASRRSRTEIFCSHTLGSCARERRSLKR